MRALVCNGGEFRGTRIASLDGALADRNLDGGHEIEM